MQLGEGEWIEVTCDSDGVTGLKYAHGQQVTATYRSRRPVRHAGNGNESTKPQGEYRSPQNAQGAEEQCDNTDDPINLEDDVEKRENELYQISVRNHDGRTIHYEVCRGTTVGYLKSIVEEKQDSWRTRKDLQWTAVSFRRRNQWN
jgi:hypothetical protein